VTDGAAMDWDPIWSPDGKYLYFSSDRGGSMNLWRVAINEESGEVRGEAEPLTTPSAWSGQIKTSRDGRSIVYVSVDAKSNVKKIAFDPAKERVVGLPVPVTQGARQVGSVDPSPDGQLLVYYSTGKQENLVVISNDGSNPVQLTNDQYKNRGPRWSPDGKRIIFYSNRSGHYELWCINPDGSGLEQMTKTSGESLTMPEWLPDGEHAFCSIMQKGTFIIDLKVPIDERKPQPLVSARGSDTVFSVNSVSPDGRFLAGYWVTSNDEVIPRVLVYSLQSKTYRTVADSGFAGPWLSDSRRLFYYRNGRVYLVDTQTKKSHQILAPPEGEGIGDLRISRDNRMLYYVSGSSDSDIWQAAIK